MPTITDSITEYLNRFMVFPDPDHALACALWALHTWTFSESFPAQPWTTPYLYINSTESRSGKTLLIDLLEPICLNPERTVDMTSSVMFRLIEHVRPTLFIDEVDTIWSGAKNEGLRGVLNGGYKKGGYVWRNAPGKDGPEPTKFATFSPKLLAGIDNGHLPETIYSRCLPIRLSRVATIDDDGALVAPDGTTREVYYEFMAGPTADQLQREIQAFMAEWAVQITRNSDAAPLPKPIKGINPRSWEIIMPLVQIAARIGIEDQVREMFPRLLAPPPAKDTPEQAMFRIIRDLFESTGADKLHSSTICEALGEGWNGKLLGNKLRAAGVTASTTLNIGNRAAKGYYKHQFYTAFTTL